MGEALGVSPRVSYKIFKPRFRLDVRKRFFSIRVIDKWNSLSTETVSAENIGSFKGLLMNELATELYRYAD